MCTHQHHLPVVCLTTIAVRSAHIYCTSGLALTPVSGHYSGQGVKLTNHLRVVLRVGMRGALPRLLHTPAVIQHCIIQPKDNFAFPLKVDAIAEHDTEGLPSPHTVANSLFTICPVIAQKFLLKSNT